MKLSKRSVLKLLAVLLLSGVTASALAWGSSLTKAQKAHAKDMKALHEVDSDWVKDYNKGKVDKLVALYEADATLMPPGTAPLQGAKAIRAYFVADVAASKKAGVKFTLTGTPDGDVTGDWGWVSGTYSVTAKDGHILDSGKYLSVSHRVKGKWHYVRDTWNSDGGIPQIGAASN